MTLEDELKRVNDIIDRLKTALEANRKIVKNNNPAFNIRKASDKVPIIQADLESFKAQRNNLLEQIQEKQQIQQEQSEIKQTQPESNFLRNAALVAGAVLLLG